MKLAAERAVVGVMSIIILALFDFGCHSGSKCAAATPTTAHSAKTCTTQPQLIATLHRRGGFAGENDVAHLYSDRHYSTEAGEEILSRATFAELSDVLSATRAIRSDYRAAAADAFVYTLEYDGRTIHWSEASGNLPSALRRLSELFGCMMTPEHPPATAASASQPGEGHGP